MKENMALFGFILSEEDMHGIDGLNMNKRYMAGWVENQWL